MTRLLAAFAILATLHLSSCQNGTHENETPDDSLMGKWKVTAWEYNGKQKELPGEMYAIFESDRVTLVMGGVEFPPFDMSVDPTQVPKHIDTTQGVTKQLGIYEIEGDTMKWCFSSLGPNRPTDFTTTTGAETTLRVLSRVPPNEPDATETAP